MRHPLWLGLISVLPSIVATIHSAQVTLTWNANTETNLAGYKVYVGSAGATPSVQTVGLKTSTIVSNLTIGKAYSFYATAYNLGGLESSPSLSIQYTIPDKPVITLQPTNQNILLGSSVTFSVQATSAIRMGGQWYFGSTPIVGATNNSFSIGSVQAGDAGVYSFTASNNSGVTTSAGAVLAVVSKPSILVEPIGQTILLGSGVNLTVQASGTAPLTYQWFKDGSAITGAIAATYQVAAAVGSDAGSYSVQVSNPYGMVQSGAAVVSVTLPPVVVTQPVSTNVARSAALTLSLQASGTAPLSFQWYRNGSALTGATASVYQVSAAQTNDAGAYFAVVRNGGGTTTSLVATVTVTVPPSISVQPAGLSLTAGTVLSLSVSADGTAPFQYQWFKNRIPIAGAASALYQISAVEVADAGDYSVTISNSAGTITSDYATVVVKSPAPAAPTGLRVLN